MSENYNAEEFDTVAYMLPSGGLGCPDSQTRQDYYNAIFGVDGVPAAVFDGEQRIMGASPSAPPGSSYEPVIIDMLGDPTPVRLTITEHDFTTAPHVALEVELEGSLEDVSQTVIRVAILENGLSYEGETYDNVLRDLLDDIPLTIDSAGQIQQESVEFMVDPTWNPDNLRLIVFVQDDATGYVLQATTTRPEPDYTFRYYALGDRMIVGTGFMTLEDYALFNTGALTDTYTVSLDTSGLPEAWDAYLVYDGGEYTSLDVMLAPGESAVMNVAVNLAAPGWVELPLEMHAHSGLAQDRRLVYDLIYAGNEVLLVDDDHGASYESDYFEPAIAATGREYAVWNRDESPLTGDMLSRFDIVVWFTGDESLYDLTLDEADRTALAAFLDGGGRLFITGQAIGWDLIYNGGPEAVEWYHQYLHADYVSDYVLIRTLSGVDGDPVSDGLELQITGAGGANNQDFPEDIDPYGDFGTTILTYDTRMNGAVRADTGIYRVVYFSFGFEAINDADDRALVMTRVLDWLAPQSTAAPPLVPSSLPVVHGNSPNPFNPRTTISFSLPKAGPVDVAVFDLAGRRLRDLAHGHLGVGRHEVVWDGCDGSGRAMPSGTYVVRLTADDGSEARKMMLVR